MGIVWEENNHLVDSHKIHQDKGEVYLRNKQLEWDICQDTQFRLDIARNFHHCNDNKDKQVVQDMLEQILCRIHQGISLED
jgi:hypothetical protein